MTTERKVHVELRQRGERFPKRAVWLLNALVDWYDRAGGANPLWYPSSTVETRIGLGGRAQGGDRSRVPTRQMPHDIAVAERALRDMPSEQRTALAYRHLGTYAEYRRDIGGGRTSWDQRCLGGYWFLMGVLQRDEGLRDG